MTSDLPEMRRAFCARLKTEREQRGTSLAAIADATKVKMSLLEALERGDVSRWPKGIYRRAFFRDYLMAIGLPLDPSLSQFLQLFPDGEAPVAAAPLPPASAAYVPAASGTPATLRLTFAEGTLQAWTDRVGTLTRSRHRQASRRAVAAALDAALVVGIAYAVSFGWKAELFWPVLGVAATAYALLSTAILGRSLALTLLMTRGPMTRWSWNRSLWPRRRVAAGAPSPRVGELVGQALRARSVLHESISRLSRTPPLRSRRERQRELSAARRRRAEAATRAVDDASRVMG